MKQVERVSPDGTVTVFDSIAKAAEGSAMTPYFVSISIRRKITTLNGYLFREAAAPAAPAAETPVTDLDQPQAGVFVDQAADGRRVSEHVQADPIPQQAGGDRLAQALRNFGLGVVVMEFYNTPVPQGHFYVTAMCQAAGKLPQNFVNAPATKRDVKRTAEHLRLPEDQVIVSVRGTGPYAGTWIHRDLAFALALYCDADGERGVRATVSRALAAYADAAPAGPSIPQAAQQADPQHMAMLRDHEEKVAAIRRANEEAIAKIRADSARELRRIEERGRVTSANQRRIRGLPITPTSQLPPYTFNLCEAAERAAGEVVSCSSLRMKIVLSGVKRPDSQGAMKDMWYWIPVDLRLEPVRDPADPSKAYKQVKKDGHRIQEVSRYSDNMKRLVIGKMRAVYFSNSGRFF